MASGARRAEASDRYRRKNRVLVAELAPQVTLTGPEAHHLADVLRLRPGAVVEAFDGRGAYAPGVVSEVGGGAVRLALEAARRSEAEAPIALTLAVALLKGDKLAEVIRPATELGVADFRLIHTAHSDVARLPAARLARLERVAQEAARQCGRAVVPPVSGPVSLADLVAEQSSAPRRQVVVVADPRAQASLSDVVTALQAAAAASPPDEGASVVVVTGPEGGLAAAEVEALERVGAVAVGLGPRILRAETAPVALAAALLLGAA